MPAPKKPSRRGRTPFDGTVALRKLLKADFEAAGLNEKEFYVRWLVEKDPEIGLIGARRIVWRERRKYLHEPE